MMELLELVKPPGPPLPNPAWRVGRNEFAGALIGALATELSESAGGSIACSFLDPGSCHIGFLGG